MKIVLIGYYELKESLLSAANELQAVGYDVVGYPLFQLAYDSNSKISDYATHLYDFISAENPQIVLWWFTGIPYGYMARIRKSFSTKLFVLFNWNDPFEWTPFQLEFSHIDKKAALFDLVFSSCEESAGKYIENGTPLAMCLFPGHDITCDKQPDNYEYDVVFGITNEYADEQIYSDQFIVRRHLIEQLDGMRDIKVGLFGPEYLKQKYPNSYVGHASYKTMIGMYKKSRICVCTHVISTARKYLNERAVQILGSGSLLLVDRVNGNDEFLNEGNCVFIDKIDPASQVREILASYSEYDFVKRRGHELSKQFTWSKWAERVDCEIQTHSKIMSLTPSERKSVRTTGFNSDDYKLVFSDYCELIKLLQAVYDKKDGSDLESNMNRIIKIIDSNPYSDINRIIEDFFRTF
jgi:hypothetical protein